MTADNNTQSIFVSAPNTPRELVPPAAFPPVMPAPAQDEHVINKEKFVSNMQYISESNDIEEIAQSLINTCEVVTTKLVFMMSCTK